jgi:hypothetical protein
MANSLNREIKKGEEVVVKASRLKQGLTLEQRIFVCNGLGFGVSPDTMGHTVYGYWKDGSGEDRIEGDSIDAKETAKLQSDKKCTN